MKVDDLISVASFYGRLTVCTQPKSSLGVVSCGFNKSCAMMAVSLRQPVSKAFSSIPPDKRMFLCMHQATSANAGFRGSLEGYARAGFRHVELVPSLTDAYVEQHGVAGARQLLRDLGLAAVSSGGVPGLFEPTADRGRRLDELKFRAERLAQLGIDRVVCPSITDAKFALEDYEIGVQNMREVGDVVRPFGVTAMVEFTKASSFIGTLQTAISMVQLAAHPFVKVMLDTFHFQAGLSKFEDLALLGTTPPHHVHFQDVDRSLPRELLTPTTRSIPSSDGQLPAIVERLHQLGYAGPLSVELLHVPDADPFEIAAAIRRSAEPMLRHVGS
eukprot:TRINITY_DN28040_c0_g1_i1.p1 TRINITY_DN28040_c0_g1~~TRINITY_DN28040_c0_g1_i1.p1  ORF type:complete len:330 (+),score=59.45 TRINITY_DN28040_c0_g1_i1:105-1094(+)